jgi:hypothetical protein
LTAQTDETIYVDDPDAKKFFEMRDHDAKCLQPGDLLMRGGQLRRVKEVKKKTVRNGIDWKVILDNGFTFDPQDSVFSHRDAVIFDLRNITFWRPRKGF